MNSLLIAAIYTLGGALYITIGTAMATVMVDKFKMDFWETPGPLLATLAWPLVLPGMLGGSIGKRLIARAERPRLPAATARERD